MIWLFANKGFGGPFLAVAARLAAERESGVTGVVSDRIAPRITGFRRLRRRLRSGLTRARRERAYSEESGLPTIAVEDVNSSGFIGRIGPDDHGVIAGFDQIFRAPLIGRFSTLVNFHPSMLPYYRGPVPSYWCLENDEEVSGYTLHEVTAEIDRGAILHQGSVPTAGAESPSELDLRIAELGAGVLDRWLDHVLNGAAFDRATLDAAALYRTHVNYRSFPKKKKKTSAG